jgi:hypothetical protein
MRIRVSSSLASYWLRWLCRRSTFTANIQYSMFRTQLRPGK